MTMTNDKTTILDAIDPEHAEHLITRADEIEMGASTPSYITKGLAIASVPVALAALTKDAFAQAPAGITDVLNFALLLEIFENEFYKAVLGTSTSAIQNAAFATVRTAAQSVPGATAALQQIQKHEQQHVDFLMANGASNILNLNAGSFDFTGARGAGNGPFAQALSDLHFLLALAQGAEDTGVRAYKGQAPNLMSDSVRLEAALRIHSVEARHASKIRRLRRAAGAPSDVRYAGYVRGGGTQAAGISNLTNVPSAAAAGFAAIYAGEDNTTQAGVSVTSMSGVPSDIDMSSAATMAFDEPLTRAQVTAIVQPFFVPDLP
jgi:hypothetical protein